MDMAQADQLAKPFGEAMPPKAEALFPPLEMALAAARLLQQARRYGFAESACEDIVQDTLLAAWKNLSTLRAPERFDAWITGICRHLCWRWRRVSKRPEQSTISLTTLWDGSSTFSDSALFDLEEMLSQQDMQTLLEQALGHLPEDTRLLIQLCYLAETPHRVVAERLGVSLSTLEGRLFRARRELANIFRGALLEDAHALGLVASAAPNQLDHDWQKSEWRSTRIWCPNCGR